jgi:hypothetical protein
LEICADEKKTSDYWEVIEDPTKTKSEKDLMPTSQIHPGFQGLFEISSKIHSIECSIDFSQSFESTLSINKNLKSSCKESSSFWCQVGAQFTSFATIPTVRFMRNTRLCYNDSTLNKIIDFSQF